MIIYESKKVKIEIMLPTKHLNIVREVFHDYSLEQLNQLRMISMVQHQLVRYQNVEHQCH